jgi:hypothetical protein
MDGFWGGLFLGNDASTLAHLAFGPKRADAAKDKGYGDAKDKVVGTIGRALASVPTKQPFGDIRRVVRDEAGNVEVWGRFAKLGETALGRGVELASTAATIAKASWDVGSFIVGIYHCSN